jgi:hypothetical protein
MQTIRHGRRDKSMVNNPVRFSLKGKILKVRLEGFYTMQDFVELLHKAFESPDTPEKVAVLVDRRHSCVNTANEEDLQSVFETIFSYHERVLCLAYVASSDFFLDFVQEASKFAKYNNLPRAETFRRINEAEHWIRHNVSESKLVM